MVDAGYSGDILKDWYDAFHILRQLVLSSNLDKKVIFIDELSWMDAKNSSMVLALENFWNKNIASNGDVVLIIASSSTSWIVNKVFSNKGGLYNRLTRRIYLKEFSLKEVNDFLKVKNINYSYANIIDGYLAIGGIPYYWDLINKSESIISFIDRDDQIINLLEMKYCNDKYELSYSEVLKLQNRVDNLMKISKYKKGVQVTIVTPYGLVDNSHSSFISSVITLNDLFNN